MAVPKKAKAATTINAWITFITCLLKKKAEFVSQWLAVVQKVSVVARAGDAKEIQGLL